MKLFRSKSCVLRKGDKTKTNQNQHSPNKAQNQVNQQPIQRRFSLQNLKNRARSKQQKQKAYIKVFKQRILNYIELRSDIEIINFYNEYKEQFLRKSINLQNLLYEKPQIRHKYLSQENPHFFKGFQQTLLNLFRKKALVPGEFKNMRAESVEEIEKWVFSWIQRQILYEKAIQQEELAIKQTLLQLDQIKEYNFKVQNEPALF